MTKAARSLWHSFLMIGTILAVIGCDPAPPPDARTRREGLSTMENDSDTLEGLKQLQEAFRAEVVAVMVRESTNLLAESGIKNGASMITNTYFVHFRDEQGRMRSFGGQNAPQAELDCLKKLSKGSNYTFPTALRN